MGWFFLLGLCFADFVGSSGVEVLERGGRGICWC